MISSSFVDKRGHSMFMHKLYFKVSKMAVTSLVLIISVLASLILNKSSDTYATTSTLTISVTDNISLNITPTNSTGTFAHSDTTTPNISIKTTNGSGYTLGIKASTEGSNALINTTDNTKMIPSITTSGGISESTYSTDSSYNNTWGFRPSKINSVANSNYLPAPTSSINEVVLDTTTTTSNPTTANTYNIALGTRIDNTTAPGSYANTFVITATANPNPYTITYNRNTTDTVTNMPSNESSSSYSDTVNISSTVPVRGSYSFEGWCTVQVADGADCTGTSYPAGSNWIIDQTVSSNSLVLYARWKLYIQDLTLSQCQKNVGASGNPANIGDAITVYDKRDGNDYTVRYINGSCWMTKNLRITGTISAEHSNFTGSNFNVSQYDLNDTNHCGWSNNTGLSNVCSHDSGDNSTGVWYNYAAATAGQIIGGESTSVSTQDICPKNWHLPSGPGTTSGTDFNLLAGNTTAGWQQGNNAIVAFQGVGGGNYYDGAQNPHVNGYWWTSTPQYFAGRYGFAYGSGDGWFRSDYQEQRSVGQYVRCVMKPTM